MYDRPGATGLSYAIRFSLVASNEANLSGSSFRMEMSMIHENGILIHAASIKFMLGTRVVHEVESVHLNTVIFHLEPLSDMASSFIGGSGFRG